MVRIGKNIANRSKSPQVLPVICVLCKDTPIDVGGWGSQPLCHNWSKGLALPLKSAHFEYTYIN